MNMKKRNTLITAAILSVLSVQAHAWELKMPAFLGGKPDIAITMPPPAATAPTTPYVAPEGASTQTKAIGKVGGADIQANFDKVTGTTPVVAAKEVAANASTPAAAAPAVEEKVTVNPYTGNRSDIERMRASVELATLNADLLAKKMEAEKQKFLLDNKDKIFSSDLKERLGQGRSSGSSAAAYPDESALPKPSVKKLTKAQKMKLQQEQEALYRPAPMPVVPYVEPVPQLVGVMTVGGAKKAMIALNGQTTTVGAGEMFMGKTVSAIESDSVKLNGIKISMAQVVNTFDNPDKQALGTGAITTGANVPIGAPIGGALPTPYGQAGQSQPMVQGQPDPQATQAEVYRLNQMSPIIDPSTPQGRDQQAMSNLQNMQ